MELDLPTPVSRPPSLEWCLRAELHTQGAKVVKVVHHHLNKTYWWALVGIISCLIQWKEGGIQVLVGLAQSSQTVGSNIE
jgi:hypothetical protein